MSVTEILEQPQDTPQAPKRSTGQIVLWVVLAIVAFMAAATLLAISLVAFGSSSAESDQTGAAEIETGTSLQAAESITTVAAVPTESTVQSAEETATTTSTLASPRTDGEAVALLLSFSDAWRTADWDRMSTFASDNVVATAKEWYSEGGSPNISADNLEFVFDTCSVDGAGATACMFTYAPPEGFGLIFTAVYADNGSGLALSQLTFGGDAG